MFYFAKLNKSDFKLQVIFYKHLHLNLFNFTYQCLKYKLVVDKSYIIKNV